MKNLFKTLLISLSLVITIPAIAGDNQSTGFYGGIGGGAMSGDEIGTKYTSLNSIGLIGFKFNSNVSIEAEASVVGAKDKIVVKGLGNTAINHNVGLSHSGVFIKLELPKSGSITPYGRLGVLDSKAKLTLGNGNYEVTDTNLAYGLGINYEWGDNASIRIDYTAVEPSSNTDASVISVMRVFSF